MGYEDVILLKPKEVEEWVEQNISLTAPFQKATMKFIKDPYAGWNQIQHKDITNIISECGSHGFWGEKYLLGGATRTVICEADHLNSFLMSQTPVTDYGYRVLAYIGSQIDKGIKENMWKGVNQEKKAELVEHIAQVLKKANSEVISNFVSLIEHIN